MIASNDSPTAAPLPTDWRPLAPGARGAGLLSGAIEFVTMSGLATAADWLWLSGVERWPFPTGALTAVAVAYFAFSGFVHPILLFRSWRWRLDASALVTHYGWLWRKEHAVPLDRIQHVDVDSGPIDRVFAISTVTVYTAGSGHASLEIPGLSCDDAHRLRDTLLGREPDVDVRNH
jgi:membrane protein YdbS with pleckstrin-like domain